MARRYGNDFGVYSPGVCIIHDESTRERCTALAETLGLRPVSADTAHETQVKWNAVVIDVDMAAPGRVQQLKRIMAALDRDAPRFFAVEPGAGIHAATVQANALGATRILRRPLRTSDLRSEIEAAGIRLVDTLQAKPGGASIKAAGKLLDAAFASLVAGTPLDVAQASSASQELLSGIRQAGLSHWLDTVRAHHTGTFQHCLLVSGAATAFALEARIPESAQVTLVLAALLHDIGKAAIPLEILDKPGRLTEAEFEIIKRHPLIGRDYLNGHSRGLPPEVTAAVTHHHEYLDGTGYPHQLEGYEIDPVARIITVCDIYGALIEQRAYKPANTPAEAIRILQDMAAKGKVDAMATDILSRAVLKSSTRQPESALSA